ncbi:hypothetical protein PUR23_05420 [Methylorubrum populi]|uniref:hypothetical protein n=1 Tax=Methylorubrum populi TaxID=223967 RepID=UPI0031F95318
MTWTRRTVTPHHLPFGPDGRTYDPGLVVETSRIDDAQELAEDRIWKGAPLTRAGRFAVLRPSYGDAGPALLHGWRVRRVGSAEHAALVLRLDQHFLNGRVASAAPERVALRHTDRLLVVTPDLVVGVNGADEDRAFGHLADVMLGTRQLRRRRPRVTRAPADDVAALVSIDLARQGE